MGDLTRAFSYDQFNNPVMVIFKKQIKPSTAFSLDKKKVEGYLIDLNDIWMYSRDHYPATVRVFYGYDAKGVPQTGFENLTYDQAMFAKCEELCHQFDLGVITSRKMAEIASMIEEGIDELVAMPPQREPEKHVIGEAKITVEDSDSGGFKKTVDITS